MFTVQKANYILGFIKGWMASKSREETPLLYSAVMTSQLDYCIQGMNSMDLFRQVKRKAVKIVRGLKHLSCEERLRELGLLSLEEEKVLRRSSFSFSILKRAYKTG